MLVDNDSLSGVAIIFGFIIIQGLLTLVQAALMNVRTGQIRDLVEQGNRRARRVEQLNATPSLGLTFQIYSLLLNFAIATFAVLKVAEPMIPAEATSLDSTMVYVATLAVVGLVSITLGNIVPEAIGSGYANTIAMWFAGMVGMLVLLARPLMIGVLGISRLLSSLARSSELVNTITEEEIMTLVDAGHTGGTIEDEEKEMIYSVLQLDQTRVSEMMVPRIDVVSVEINQSLGDAAGLFIQSGYSRIPVYEENIDHIRGLLYAKDLLEYWSDSEDRETKSVSDLMRSAYFVPETKRADELLKELQARKVHLAIVIDEYGGTAGLVTIEDIIEEIIGEIRDEYDLHEEADYEQHSELEYTCDAGIDLDDFNILLNVTLPTDDSDTLGGYVYTYLGRVPIIGDTIETEDLTMKVLSVEGRRIRKIHVTRKQPGTEVVPDEPTDSNDDPEPKKAKAAG